MIRGRNTLIYISCIAVLFLSLITGGFAHAAIQSSASYTMQYDGFGTAGGGGSSTSYQLQSSILGQPVAGGQSSSANAVDYPGFSFALLSQFNPASAATLVVSGITSPRTIGAASDIIVEAKDASGNRATSYVGAVTFTSSDPQAILPASYTFTAADAGIHTVTSGVTLRTVGMQSVTATDTVTSSITGTQAGITVNKGNQAIGAISFSPTTLAVGGSTTVSATATSGLAVNFTSTSPGICTVSGTIVIGINAGVCNIAADQAGDANYNAASRVTQNISVGTGSQATVPRFAYVANNNSNTVSMYTVDGTTGELRHSGYVVTGTNPNSVTVDPSGKFVYVANNGSSNVSVYTINQTTGALTAGTMVAAGTAPRAVTIDPSGKFAYVANQASNDISVYTIDQSTGALTAGTTVAAGTGPISVTVDPSGRFAYAANVNSNTISVYSINQSTGALTAGTAVAAGAGPRSVTVDPSGKFAYSANYAGNTVSVFTINQNTGALTAGTAVASGTTPEWVAVDPSGKFAYVPNYNSNNVSVYSINQTTGALTAGTAVAAGTNPQSVAVDPSGKFAYAANYGSNDISAFAINQTTGALTLIRTISAQQAPYSIAMVGGSTSIVYIPKFAYVTNVSSDTISVYSIDKTTGTLTAGTDAATGSQPRSVAVAPNGKFAYATNYNAGTVSVFTVDQATGVLAAGTAVAAGTMPASIVVDPSGRFAYVANYGSDNVSVYTIHQTTGALTAGTAVAAGTSPHSITVDPSGKFAYVANLNTNNVSVYTINQATGALTAGTPVATGTLPRSVTVDPTGKFAYVASQGTNNVSVYTIDQITGALTAGTALAAGTIPYSVTVDPSGKFAYVANLSSNDVSVYTINQTTGALTAGTTMAAGNSPLAVTSDPSGKFAYVVSSGTTAVLVYAINSVSGALTAETSIATGSNPSSVAILGTISSAPDAPTLVSAIAGSGQATVSFTAPTNDGGSAITGYTVTSSPSGFTATGTASPIAVTGLTNGTVYTFTVTATNIVGTGPASSASNTVTPKASQTISFGTAPSITFGGSAGTVSASATSGLSVTLTSLTTDVCTISGATVTPVAAGMCTIAATQAGDTNYNSAAQMTQSFTVSKANQAIGTISFTPTALIVGGTTTVSATATSGLAVTFTSTSPGICSVSGNTVTAIASGVCSIAANQAGDANYSAAPQVSQSIAVVLPGNYIPKFAYVANWVSNNVSVYSIDPATGTLTGVGTPVMAGTNPISVTVDPFGKFAYVANYTSNDISIYTINQTTGILTAVTTVAAGTGPQSVTVDPSGKFAYVANPVSSNVSVYTINQSTGALTAGITVAAGTSPNFVTVDPSGKFAYVSNWGSNNVSVYSINTTTGGLTAATVAAAGTNPYAVVVDPSGRFAYVANYTSNNVSMYSINQTTGALTAGGSVPAGSGPWSIIVDPSGKFAYVANKGSDNVSMYTISQSNGALTEIGAPVAAGTGPRSVTIDPSGKYAYVANFSSDNVSLYTIDQVTGALTVGTTVASISGACSVATTGGIATIADSRDGNVYKITTIGTQTWMAENLRYAGAGRCYNNDNTPANCDAYGRAYTFAEAIAGETPTATSGTSPDVHGICPSNWHLPSSTEWNTLLTFVGGNSSQKLRASGLVIDGVPGTDLYDFNWKPSAFLSAGSGNWIDGLAMLWSSTHEGNTYAYLMPASPYNAPSSEVAVYNGYNLWTGYLDAWGIRCVKDNSQNSLSVTPSAGANGSITPNTSQTVTSGATTTFTVTPDAGYTATVGGTCGGALSGTIYTTNAITADCTVEATFAQSSYTVTFTPGGNGTLTGTTSQTVAYNSSATAVTATANSGYHFVNWTGTGGFVTTTANPLTVTNITATMTITANFTADQINGACGPANGQAFSASPTVNLCSAGSPSSVTGSGPWSWTCSGANGGSTTSCSAVLLACTITTGALVNGSYGTGYSQPLTATCGVDPLVWSLAGGDLPSGLAIVNDTLSGVPTQAGSYNFVLKAADSAATPQSTTLAYNLTVDKAPLTVTAVSTTKSIGSVNPALTASYTGFVNGDTGAVLAGSPIITTTATTSSPYGTYDITISQGTLNAPNYAFSFVNGTLGVLDMATTPDGRTIAPIALPTTPGSQVNIAAGTLLKDMSDNPVSGTLTVTSSSTNNLTALPSTAATGHATDGSSLVSLGASIDLIVSTTAATVKSISPPMTISLAVPASFAPPGTTVGYYSFDGTSWKSEGSATVKADNSIDMQVGHLSIWAVGKFQPLPTGKIVSDGTSTVTIADALRALQIAVGMVAPTANDLQNGDVAPLVNGRPSPNGSINVGDAIVILQKSLGIVSW